MNAFIITEKNLDFKWFYKDFCNFLEKIMQKRGLHVEQFRVIMKEHSKKGGTRMQIEGMQKLTLLDYPGKTAAILFAHGCDFRCPFCHNAGLVTRPMANAVSEDEILSYLYKRRGLLDGVVLTGGEPLLQPDAGELLRKIRNLGYAVKLDTNGSFPDRLAALLDAGLVDYVAMDIKNRPEKYKETAGCTDAQLAAVCRSVDLLLAGRVDYEFRTTVTGRLHTPADIGAAAAWIAGAKHYFLQPFKDSGDLVGDGDFTPDDATLADMLAHARRSVPNTELRG